MNRNLYFILISFCGLATATSITNSIISLKFGPDIWLLNSYIAWFSVVTIVSLITSLLLLGYYYYQNYLFVFFTGLIFTIVNLSYFIVIYIIQTSGELKTCYIPTLLLSICADIVYTLGLIFSFTRKRFWLKLAGVCGFFVCIVVLLSLIGNIYSKNIEIIRTLSKIEEWTSMASGLVPVLYIINFLSELRILKTRNLIVHRQKSLEGLLIFTGIAAFLSVIIFGILFTNESYSITTKSSSELYWKNYNAQRAQDLVKRSETRTFISGKGDSLHYLLMKPQGYDPQKNYPLLVCLPYGGYEAAAAELLSEDGNKRAYPAFIFVPYCEDGTGWGGIPGYPSRDILVYETINSLADPGIDVKRRYVTGISRGGYGAWQFICARPDMFAAAIPVCGGGDPELGPKIVRIAVWAFHGAEDKNVPVSGSRDMIAAIKKAGGHPKYTEFSNATHNIWDQVIATPGVWDWLFAQRRE